MIYKLNLKFEFNITILNNLICSLKHFTSIFRSQVVEGEAFNSELPTILKNRAEKLEAEPVNL
ncbi:hypothetical protein [Nostoc sp.]|uniref:hypothetical protein n=1 Tax=Nostoc sp. TaxID=1180 RepID=UPI002FFCD901